MPHPLDLPDHVVNPGWSDSTVCNTNPTDVDYPVVYTHTKHMGSIAVGEGVRTTVYVEQDIYLSLEQADAQPPVVRMFGDSTDGETYPTDAAIALGRSLIAAASLVADISAATSNPQTTPEN